MPPVWSILTQNTARPRTTADGMPRTLLMEYVRYARDSALDVFESNYLSMLLGMQNEKAVKNYEALSSVE